MDGDHTKCKNVGDLQELLETRIEALESLFNERTKNSEQSSLLLASDIKNRFDSVNEFRAHLGEQQQTFLTRNEYNVNHQALSEKIDSMGRTNWPVIFSVIGIVGALWAAGIAPLNGAVSRLDAQNAEREAQVQNIAENGSPITINRLSRLESAVFK